MAVVNAEIDQLVAASEVATAGQAAAQEAGLDQALEGLRAEPYVDGQRVVYTYAEAEVANSGSEGVMELFVGEVNEEDDGVDVLYPPVTQEDTPTSSSGGLDEVLSYCDVDKTMKVLNFRSEQFIETVDLEAEVAQREKEGVEEVAEKKIEKILNRMMEKKAKGRALSKKSSRLAFLEACTSSGISDLVQANIVIIQTLDKIDAKRKGKNT